MNPAPAISAALTRARRQLIDQLLGDFTGIPASGPSPVASRQVGGKEVAMVGSPWTFQVDREVSTAAGCHAGQSPLEQIGQLGLHILSH